MSVVVTIHVLIVAIPLILVQTLFLTDVEYANFVKVLSDFVLSYNTSETNILNANVSGVPKYEIIIARITIRTSLSVLI